MYTDKLGCITPEKLQDYITCPLRFKYKHVDKTNLSLSGKEWCNRKINESFQAIVFSRQIPSRGELKTPSLCPAVLVEGFTNKFNHPYDSSGEKLDLHWKNDSPEPTHVYGMKCVPELANYPELKNMQIQRTERVIDLYLQTDLINKTYIPCSSAEMASFVIQCRFDGILLDQSILHFSSYSSRKRLIDHFISKIEFGLLSLAKNQLSGYSIHHKNQIKVINLIQSQEPEIQKFSFERDMRDHQFTLKYIFDYWHQMNHSMFQPRENKSCLTQCSYKHFCGLFPRNERN